jgi:hypothetical protein
LAKDDSGMRDSDMRVSEQPIGISWPSYVTVPQRGKEDASG